MRKSEKKGLYFWSTLLPILGLTFLESTCSFRQIGFKKNDGYFFRFDWSSGPMWAGSFKSKSENKMKKIKIHSFTKYSTASAWHTCKLVLLRKKTENKMKKKTKSKFHRVFVRIIVPSITCKLVLLKKKIRGQNWSFTVPPLPDAVLKTIIWYCWASNQSSWKVWAGYSVKHFEKYSSKNHTLHGIFGAWR